MAHAVELEGGTQFRVIAGSSRSQAAEMTLPAGESTGGPDNRHAESDQWVLVLSGTGTAVVEGTEYELSPRTLLLIEAGEAHELRSGSEDALDTINFYAPPEY